jgi:hypothetical protein
MLGDFLRGQIIDLSIIFISNVTGVLIDPINPTVEIVHYEGYNEVIDLAEIPVVKVTTRPVGYFTYEFTIPGSFILNELYYVRWRGTDPNDVTIRDVQENHFKVVDGSSSGSGCCGLVPRFTTC